MPKKQQNLYPNIFGYIMNLKFKYFYLFIGCVFDMVSNSQFNLMQDMLETTKPKEQCHAMVHILQYD